MKKHFNATHGEANKSKEYGIWIHIKDRCYNPKCREYKFYGERGITMYEPWRTDFAAFVEHIGRCPTPQHSLDRIENGKGYVPNNLRWATKKEQARNTRQTMFVEYKGERVCMRDLAEKHNIKPTTLWQRITKFKMSVEEAVNRPVVAFEKIILLDTATGIFYESIAEASRVFQISESHLRRKVHNQITNNTNLIAV